MTDLRELIADRIRSSGPISFAELVSKATPSSVTEPFCTQPLASIATPGAVSGH